MNLITAFFTQSLPGRTILGYVLIFGVPTALPFLFVKVIGFKGLRHLFSYEPKQSIVHRLDPRIKVLYPVLIGILSVFLNWDYVYLLVVFTLIPWLLLRPSPGRARVIITMVGIPVIGAIWSQGLFHTEALSTKHLLFIFPQTLSWIGTPGLSSTGLLYGLQQAGRTMAGVLAALILLFTTTPSEVVWAFYKFGMPAPVGLAFSAALRFLPQMMERMTVLLQIVQVRGYDLTIPRWWQVSKWPGYLWRVCACIPVITIPLLIGSLRTTSVMAMVVDARAFGSHSKRNSLHTHSFSVADYIAITALVCLTLAVALLVLLHIGNRQV
ncbi:MAG: energy-coupling factor transporter transmembrane protein EcfT [Ktedonobacteraceae bacterium]|nr:energy-coupling factor transporter transmembrane protein EcfT [Ktedonobacteraceae bacterium]